MMSKTKLCDSSNKANEIQDPLRGAFCRDLLHKASTLSVNILNPLDAKVVWKREHVIKICMEPLACTH